MVVTKEIRLQTDPTTSPYRVAITDITSRVEGIVIDSGITSGIATVFVSGSTAGVTTIEFEPGLISDFEGMWERIIPRNIPYNHDRAWGEGNGYSHVRASLLGASLVVPFTEKRLALGTWQQVVFVDFDNRPRSRLIAVQVMGE